MIKSKKRFRDVDSHTRPSSRTGRSVRRRFRELLGSAVQARGRVERRPRAKRIGNVAFRAERAAGKPQGEDKRVAERRLRKRAAAKGSNRIRNLDGYKKKKE